MAQLWGREKRDWEEGPIDRGGALAAQALGKGGDGEPVCTVPPNWVESEPVFDWNQVSQEGRSSQ